MISGTLAAVLQWHHIFVLLLLEGLVISVFMSKFSVLSVCVSNFGDTILVQLMSDPGVSSVGVCLRPCAMHRVSVYLSASLSND
jgi:hypothetical protein